MSMYLQKVIIQKNLRKIFFVCVLKITDEKSWIRIRFRIYNSERYGSADPDPDQNVTDRER
jgi:hypothetical protein